MSDADSLMDGSAWRQFCRALEQAGEIVLAPPSPAAPIDRAEGYRYLTRLLRIALEMSVECADPDFPTFFQASHRTAKIGADNPDNEYLNAALRPDRTYRIAGTRGTVPILTFATKANRYATDGTMASTGELDALDVISGDDGHIEIIVSRTRPHGAVNWLPMESDTSFMVVRQTFGNRSREQAANLRITALDAPAAPAALTPAFMAAALRNSTGFVSGTANTFKHWAELFRAEQLNQLATVDQSMFQRAGGDPTIFYLHGFWQLAEDEALIIESEIPACRAWNIQLNNYWMESLDYRYHGIHVNHANAELDPDGQVTVVIAHRNPGFGNWLDTAGHSQGTMLWRWTGADRHPIPRARVVKL